MEQLGSESRETWLIKKKKVERHEVSHHSEHVKRGSCRYDNLVWKLTTKIGEMSAFKCNLSHDIKWNKTTTTTGYIYIYILSYIRIYHATQVIVIVLIMLLLFITQIYPIMDQENVIRQCNIDTCTCKKKKRNSRD